MRLSTTSRTVCGAPTRPTDVTGDAGTADTATTGLHDDAEDTTVGREVGGTICGEIGLLDDTLHRENSTHFEI